MSSTTVRLPTGGTLLREQLSLVTSALHREGKALAAALLLLGLFAALGGLGREPLVAEPSFLLFALPIAAMLPVAVWRGEQPFGQSVLWTLPARRHWNAAARIAAGALWLIAAMLATLAVLAIIAWASGGRMGVDEMRLVAPGGGPAGAVEQHWTTPGWEYAVPFTAVLIVYAFASAALLGLRHPLRWILGVTLTLALLLALALQTLPGSPLTQALETARHSLWLGDYGLDHALSGGVTGLPYEHELPGGRKYIVWSAMPTITPWARSTAVWLTLSLVLLALAVRRHAET